MHIRSTVSKSSLVWISVLFVSLPLLSCSSNAYYRGQYFPELEYAGGRGTILFFMLENMEYYETVTEFSSKAEDVNQLINQLKLDLSLLSNRYRDLRIIYVDMYENRSVALDYRIYGIPTVILFDQNGYEIRRWYPEDYGRGGGTIEEMGSFIERMGTHNQNSRKDTNEP